MKRSSHVQLLTQWLFYENKNHIFWQQFPKSFACVVTSFGTRLQLRPSTPGHNLTLVLVFFRTWVDHCFLRTTIDAQKDMSSFTSFPLTVLTICVADLESAHTHTHTHTHANSLSLSLTHTHTAHMYAHTDTHKHTHTVSHTRTQLAFPVQPKPLGQCIFVRTLSSLPPICQDGHMLLSLFKTKRSNKQTKLM